MIVRGVAFRRFVMFAACKTRQRPCQVVVILLCHQFSPDDPFILRHLSFNLNITLSPAQLGLLSQTESDYSALHCRAKSKPGG